MSKYNHQKQLELEQLIIELYVCSDDNRIRVIANVCGCSYGIVDRVIQEFLDKKIEFTKGNFKIYHSLINNYN